MPKVDLTGKNAIITGSNSGIGLECAKKLGGMGANLILAVRNMDKGTKAKEEIEATIKNAGSIEVIHLDNSELASVHKFVESYGDRKVDIMINSAGAASTQVSKTKDGFELTFESNFLAHFALTLLLLPKFNDHARIVNISSQGQYSASADMFALDDIDWSKGLARKGYPEGSEMPQKLTLGVYARTKLCQVFHSSEFQRRIQRSDKYKSKDIQFKSCHPGVIGTSIWGNLGSGLSAKLTTVWAKACGVSPEQGACTPSWLATQRELDSRDIYYERMQARSPNALAYDENLKQDLWALWCEATNLKDVL